jgi:hypothetical protein
VNTVEVATPLELVVSVSVTAGVPPSAKVPSVAAGAVKVTVTPLVGVPFVVTVATRGFIKGAPTAALCPPPLVAVMVTTGGVFVEFELLLQLVRNVKVEKIKIEMSNAETPQSDFRFIATLLSAWSWHSGYRFWNAPREPDAPAPGIRFHFSP